MAPAASATAEKVVQPFPPEVDPQVAATDRQTAAIQALVTELQATREAFTPAADALHSLGAAQAKFCDFIVNNRVKIIGGGLAALAAVGAISPNLANGIGIFLKAAGLQ